MGRLPPRILLAEDDDGVAHLVVTNLRRSGIGGTIRRFRDGQECLEYLRSAGSDQVAQVLLLDILMPRLDGLQLLTEIRTDPKLCLMPVLMLSTTDDPDTIRDCYRRGCNGYLVKPVDYAAFKRCIASLAQFLLDLRLPPPAAPVHEKAQEADDAA